MTMAGGEVGGAGALFGNGVHLDGVLSLVRRDVEADAPRLAVGRVTESAGWSLRVAWVNTPFVDPWRSAD
jgi:hypothetical protein